MIDDDIRAGLESWLATAAGATRATVGQVARLSGGAIQENWALDITFEGGAHGGVVEAVLRTDAPASVEASHGRAEEFALLEAAHGAGVTVPEPLWLCTDPSVMGKAFFVMRRARGGAAGHRVVRDLELGGDRARLTENLGRELARIHTIRPPRADLAFLPDPTGDPAGRAIEEYRMYLDSYGAPRPALEWGLRWAERHATPADEIVLVHRDFRTGNYMVDGTGVTAVLDWEFAHWGDPMEDLGWFCAKCWRFGAVELEAGGIGTRADFYGGYEAESGRKVDAGLVRYWEVMAHLRWAVIALQQGDRFALDGERNLEAALTAHVAPELELEVMLMTKDH